jgi:hypothetical protein
LFVNFFLDIDNLNCRKCKIKAAMLDKTLKRFVEDVLREATEDAPDDKPQRAKKT